MRHDGRALDALRDVKFTPGYLDFPAGSVLVEWGNNKIICAASVNDGVPPFLLSQAEQRGWLSSEYSLLPYSTPDRVKRAISKGKMDGRTQEIQRLVGRSLRAIMDFSKIPNKTVWVDCDVIQADGGTRTASITGGFVALSLAMLKLKAEGCIKELPMTDFLSAVSVGVVGGEPMLDLCYVEDSKADVDMNIVMTGRGKLVEVQGTAEHAPFSRDEMNTMLDLATKGVEELSKLQKAVIGQDIGV